MKVNKSYPQVVLIIIFLFVPFLSNASIIPIIDDVITYPKGTLQDTDNSSWIASSTAPGGYWSPSSSAAASNGGANWIINLSTSGYYAQAISACSTPGEDSPCRVRIHLADYPAQGGNFAVGDYAEFSVINGQITGSGQDTSRIYAVVPVNNDIEPDTSVTFEIYYYISDTDIDELSYGGSIRLTASVQPLNTIPYSASIPVIDISTLADLGAGYGVATSTVVLTNDTDYQMTTNINGSNFWNIFGDRFLSIATSTYFSIGTTANGGNVSTWFQQQMDALRGKPTSYDQVNALCNPFYDVLSASSTFDIATCIYAVIIPPTSILQSDIELVRDNFLSIVPMGYANRIVELIQSTTTVALPTLALELPENLPGAGLVLDLTPWNYLMGSTSELGTATSSLGTFRSTVENYWNWIWYILLAFAVLHDITGFGRARLHKQNHV